MRIIAGEWKGHRIKAPPGRNVRPTPDRVREAWMSALGGRLDGLTVLDLFAGSGALGLEALSRGAARVTFVERSRAPLSVLEENVLSLGARDRCSVLKEDALRFAGGLEAGAFDLALADPPYDRGFGERLVRLWARVPFARELWVEHRSGDPLPELPGSRTRRYGDTSLTAFEATE